MEERGGLYHVVTRKDLLWESLISKQIKSLISKQIQLEMVLNHTYLNWTNFLYVNEHSSSMPRTTCTNENISRDMYFPSIESLSKRRFCQQGRQPEVSCVVIDGE